MLDAQGPSSNKWDKAKQQAKDMAAQAKAKFNKYKGSDQAKEHVAKGKELMVSEKAKNVAKALGSGALAVLISGQGGKMMDLNAKADMLNKLDATAVAERTVSDNAVQVSKSQIANFTQYGGIGQKSMAQTLMEAGQKEMDKEIDYQKGVLGNMQQLQNNESNIEAKKSEINSKEADRARLEQDSKDFTTDGNQFGNAIKGANNNTFRGSEFGENFGQKAEALKSKLASHDELKKENQKATDKYYQGNTMNPALEATQQSKDAQGDAAKTILGVGGVMYAISSRKKGEKAPSKEEPKTEPNPEPIPQVPEAQQVETMTEAVQAIEGTEAQETSQEWKDSIKKIMEDEGEVKPKDQGSPTGFTADEYGPKQAPTIKKETEKVPLWKKAGKFVTQSAMVGSVIFGGSKGMEALKGQPQLSMGGANVERVNIASEGSEVDGVETKRSNEAMTPDKAADWAKSTYLEKFQSEVDKANNAMSTENAEFTDFMTKAMSPSGDRSEAAINMHKQDHERNLSRNQDAINEATKKLDEAKGIDFKSTKLSPDIASFIKDKVSYSGQDQAVITAVNSYLSQNDSLASQVKPAETIPQAQPVTASTEAPAQTSPAATQEVAKPVAAAETAPAAVKESPPVDYTIAKENIEKLASQSEIGKQMKEYTNTITTELITNLSATLAQKGASMAPADVQILTAKINALKYIQSHNGDSIYIPVAESAKATFATAATGNPESIFGKVRYGNLNKTDIATKNFDGVTMAKTYAEKGITDVQAHLDQITAARSQR
jgi:hypothetical protein